MNITKATISNAMILLMAFLLASCNDKIKHDFSKVSFQNQNSKFGFQALTLNNFDEKNALISFPDLVDDTVFSTANKDIYMMFYPLGAHPKSQLEYTHIYSNKCVYKLENKLKVSEVAIPNPCLNPNDSLTAIVKIHNNTNQLKKYTGRIFYQNSTYAFRYNDKNKRYLNNFYGCSSPVDFVINPNADTLIEIKYILNQDPKDEMPEHKDYKIPFSPGNYEFMFVVEATEKRSPFFDKNLNLRKTNPFLYVIKNKIKDIAYVGPRHFKFIYLNEKFDSTNDLEKGHVYVAKDYVEKPLVENFDNKFKNVISESWTDDDFFKGKIENAPFVLANFGNRDSLVTINSQGIELKIPKSDAGKKNKTWGEIVFASAFKYGKVSALVKFCRMRNKGTRTPNGIVHNLWLYERDWEDAFPSKYNFYKYTDPKGLQPFEIDFEIWSSLEGYEPYDSVFFINYSIVDYFKDEKCSLRPQESKNRNGFYMHRKNNRQVNIPSAPFPESFMDAYHLYQIEWKPTYVKFFIDGKLVGHITEREGAIPDKHLFFWIGSPIYQDGTFYDQRKIPFLEEDKFSHIKWIKIE